MPSLGSAAVVPRRDALNIGYAFRPRPRLLTRVGFYDHISSSGVPRRYGPAPRGCGGPRNRRTPHGRRHDDHFGEALDEALGDHGAHSLRRGRVPDDEALAHAVVDLSVGPQPTSRSPRSGHGDPAFQSLRPKTPGYAPRDRNRREPTTTSPGCVQGVACARPSPHSRRLLVRSTKGSAVSDVVVVDTGAGKTAVVRAALTHLGVAVS